MNWRDGLLAVGVLAALVGLGMAFVPSFGRQLDSPETIPFALGMAALAVAVFRLRTWIGHEDGDYSPSKRERPTGVATPGAEFDGLLARSSGRAAGGNTRPIMIRQSLRDAAVDALITYHGHTPETAEAAIADGSWSDDEYAVEFFTSAGGGGNSLSESVTSSFYGERPFHRRANHAAREIERLTRGDSA